MSDKPFPWKTGVGEKRAFRVDRSRACYALGFKFLPPKRVMILGIVKRAGCTARWLTAMTGCKDRFKHTMPVTVHFLGRKCRNGKDKPVN